MRAQIGHFSEALTFLSQRQVGAVNQAYQNAVEGLGPDVQHLDRRMALANCILDLAKGGETDAEVLRARALSRLGLGDAALKPAS